MSADAMPVTLRTERLVLRPWRESDLEPFARMNADPAVMEFFPRLHDRAESDAIAERIGARISELGYGLWAAEIPGVTPFAGFIGLQPVPAELPFAPALEVGWRLGHAWWGRGYAPEGARAALAFAHDRLGFDEVVSMTAAINLRSRRVMEKIGMVRDRAGDFEHVRIPAGNRLRAHVLYRHRRGGALQEDPHGGEIEGDREPGERRSADRP